MIPNAPYMSWITWQEKTGSISHRAFAKTWSARELLSFYGVVLAQSDDGTITIETYFQGPLRFAPPITTVLTMERRVETNAHQVDTPERARDGRWQHPVYAPEDIVEP